jgi:DNA-binding MarR family transcriptional regulator
MSKNMQKSDLEIVIEFPKITHIFIRKMLQGFQSSQKDFFVNETQGRTLLFLFDRGETTMTDLHKAIGLEKGSLTSVVDQLIKKELVERKRDGTDRRKVKISLTETGRKKTEILRIEIGDYIKNNLEKLPVKDRKKFYQAAETLLDISRRL